MKNFFVKIKQFFGGKDAHQKNAVRFFLIVVAFFVFLFFTNDFNSINIQKTAIVVAIGIDKEEDSFSVTSQIALPEGDTQSGETKTVNIVTKGDTVAQALDKVNEKTGWYPKLVFCRLILLGESATKQNVFDGLDYFLRDEYITDNCLLAACEGTAEKLLSTKTPIHTAGALAIEKVLSNHAEKVGTSLPNTLRLFASSYFGTAKSGFLPLIKTSPLSPTQTENQTGDTPQNQSSQTGESPSQSGQKEKQEGQGQDEQVFSASETALFIRGVQVGKLNEKETFAYALVKNTLQLASYSLPHEDAVYTLSIKRSSPSVKLTLSKKPKLQVDVKLTVGIADVSQSQPLQETADTGDFPKELLTAAERQVKQEINNLFDKCQQLNFDVFDAIDKLQKYEHKHFEEKKDTLLSEMDVVINVHAQSVR